MNNFFLKYDHDKTLKGALAGGIAGLLELGISYPMELIKTYMQLSHGTEASVCVGFLQCVKKIYAKRGIKGFYRGASVPLVFVAPQDSIRFGVYETLKSLASDDSGNVSHITPLFCGAGAGLSEAVLIKTPAETIKIKFIHDFQSEKPKYVGIFKGIKKIHKEEGFRGLYQGVVPTIIKLSSNHGIRFYIVESLKQKYSGGDPTVKVPNLLVGAFGITAGFISVLVNNPIDVVKTRMQGLEAKEYKNTYHCLQKIYTDEGWRTFYSGLGIRLVRVSADVGITFMLYDLVWKILYSTPFF